MSSLKEELRTTKIALNETKSLKVFSEKKLADVEASLKSGEAENINEIQELKSRFVDLKRSNEFLTEKMSDVLDRLDVLKGENEDLTKKLQTSNDEFKKDFDRMKSENILLKEENTKILTEVSFTYSCFF